MKPTALFEEHQKLGGKMVDFHGWGLPIQYEGVIEEHQACRTHAGLFDVSHMGEIHVEGPHAENFLNSVITNNLTTIKDGQAQYNLLCHEHGGIIDDLIIYRESSYRYLLVVNASNTAKDLAHLLAHRGGFEVEISDHSNQYTQIALQGPLAGDIIQRISKTDFAAIKPFHFAESMLLGEIPAFVARTGYTGEDGFELYLEWNSGPKIWKALLDAGKTFGIKPCGLAARDTLRTEMKYPLFGNDIDDSTNPIEAGLGWAVKFDKGPFLGSSALQAIKDNDPIRKLVGIQLKEKGVPRKGYSILSKTGAPIGTLTSGTFSPTLKVPIGIGYIQCPYDVVGTEIFIKIRDNSVPAQVVKTPFYTRKKANPTK